MVNNVCPGEVRLVFFKLCPANTCVLRKHDYRPEISRKTATLFDEQFCVRQLQARRLFAVVAAHPQYAPRQRISGAGDNVVRTFSYQRALSSHVSASDGAMTVVDAHTEARRIMSLAKSVNGTNSLATSRAISSCSLFKDNLPNSIFTAETWGNNNEGINKWNILLHFFWLSPFN